MSYLLETMKEEQDATSLPVFELMQKSLASMETIIVTLSQFGRGTSKPMDWQNCDTRSLAQHSAEQLLDNSSPKNYLFDGDFPVVTGDEKLLTLVFSGLLKNAFAFQEKNNNLPVIVQAKQQSTQAVFSIISPTQPNTTSPLKTLFLPFVKGSSNSGPGIGLYLCKKIIEKHGGYCNMTFNQQKKQTTVNFALPA